jgi:GNAT superfamily N-acetyltransferase
VFPDDVVVVRPLLASDDRTSFVSGDDALDRFFRHYAGQNQFRHHLGVTYVALGGERILGFATVSAGDIEPDRVRSGSRMPYRLPVLRLARLAVLQEAQGRGIGATLLRHVLRLANEMNGAVGCAGVVADAKVSAVAFYERYGFAEIDLIEGTSHARPEPIVMFLSQRAIQRGLGDLSQKGPS